MNLKQAKEFSKQIEPLATYREKEFVESILSRLENAKELTDRQSWYLNIIQEKYDADTLAEHERWTKEFSDEQRDIARKVALYYENTQYYQATVKTVLSGPKDFVLTKHQWRVFCENKYALKVLSCYKEPLKFKIADCVQVRTNNYIDIANVLPYEYPNKSARRLMANKVGFILETDAKPVTRAAKGSRIYKLLFTGETSPVYAHESDLKRKRK